MPDLSRETGDPGPSVHAPVLLREVLQYLDLAPGLVVADGTVGAGGHSRAILERIGPTGRLIGLDRDPMMLRHAEQTLRPAASTWGNVELRCGSYLKMREVLDELNIPSVDRTLLDLGLSSDQLADSERGFGIRAGGPLDLRFDPTCGIPAWELLERLDEKSMADLFREFGEERFSGPIAKGIVSRRGTRPVRTAEDLVEAVREGVPAAFQREARVHPATRIFQALRIAVNDELDHLRTALSDVLPAALKSAGRAVVITFHSLEDRIVKEVFRNKETWENVTPKPIAASPTEQRINPRSRSAKLRAAIRK